MSGRRLLVALSVAVLTIGLASPAHAQSKTAREKAAQAAAKAGRATRALQEQAKAQAANKEKKPGQRKVLRLEEMRVEGRVQKPQALFLMPRAGVSSGEQDRTESFLPRTKEALEREPF